MQAIVCEDMIGWREKARRLLVFSTDAGFHYAGDGKLGGIVKPNDGLCHLDAKGVYTHSSELDYPSVSQINHKVKENSVNLIFAVTEEQFGVYDLLQQNIEGSSVGTLSADSSNIVQLVKAQYEAITSSIEMKDNSTEYVKVTYFSNCVGDGPLRQTNRCSGLRLGQRVKFTAKIEVVKCPKDPREWHQVFQIYPVGINEAVLVDLTMMCQCECEKPGNPVSIENCAQKPKAFSTHTVFFVLVLYHYYVNSRDTLKMHLNVPAMAHTCVGFVNALQTFLVDGVNVMQKI